VRGFECLASQCGRFHRHRTAELLAQQKRTSNVHKVMSRSLRFRSSWAESGSEHHACRDIGRKRERSVFAWAVARRDGIIRQFVDRSGADFRLPADSSRRRGICDFAMIAWLAGWSTIVRLAQFLAGVSGFNIGLIEFLALIRHEAARRICGTIRYEYSKEV